MEELNNQVMCRYKNIDTKKKLISYASLKNKPIGDVVEMIVEDYIKSLGERENSNLLSFYYDMDVSEIKRYRKFKVNKAGKSLSSFFQMVKEIIELGGDTNLDLNLLISKINDLKPVLNRLNNIYSQQKIELQA